ncbi:MAG: nucleoside hydrolase, partial [Gaiellaceae bacterium]
MRRILLAAALVAALAGCGGTGARMPVVVDTDLSTDDVVALLYLVQRDDVDLRAVAVSGTGLVHCPPGARRVLELLAAAGRPDVPVACGAADPLAGYNQFPAEWRSGADELFGLPLPTTTKRAPSRGAVELLRQAVESAPRKSTLLSLAPPTDVALLLRDAHTRSQLTRIVAMGGAVGVPGNIGPGHERAEYNVWVDPVAAQQVVASGVPLTLIPLDATNDVPVTEMFADTLSRNHYATPAASLAWELFVHTGMYDGRQYFWDPLAAAAVTEPGLLTFEEKRLRVEQGSGRVVEAAGGAPVRVAVAADRRRFETSLLRALVGAPVPAPRQSAGGGFVYDGRTASYDGPRRVAEGQVAADLA